MSRRNKRRWAPAPAPIAPAREIKAPAEPSLLIREPGSVDDLHALHLLMLMQGEEFAPAPVNAAKVMSKLLTACEQPQQHRLLMAVKDGCLVGYLCLEQVGYWYSDEVFLTDFGYYVLPAHRNANVGLALLNEARCIAASQNLPLLVVVNNPLRHRGGKNKAERAASIIGFTPEGAMLRFDGEDQPPLAN